VNAILTGPKKGRELDELAIETGGDWHLLYHSDVWWKSRERVG